MFRRTGIAHPFVGYSYTAGECDFPIDNQQFAMAAIVVTTRIEPEGAVIFHHVDAGTAQPFPILLAHRAGSLRVENGVNGDAGTRPFGPRLAKLARNLSIPKDVGLEM